MDENKQPETQDSTDNIRLIVRGAIQEFLTQEQTKAEPAYKAELLEERKRREQLERRLNELVEENRRSRQLADEMDRSATIRSELQKLGVAKVDLAFRAVKDEIVRDDAGRLIAKTGDGETPYREYLAQFVNENPELLPARIPGGSGAAGNHKQQPAPASNVDLDKIKPGMSQEDLDRVRQEISRIALQTLRG